MQTLSYQGQNNNTLVSGNANDEKIFIRSAEKKKIISFFEFLK